MPPHFFRADLLVLSQAYACCTRLVHAHVCVGTCECIQVCECGSPKVDVRNLPQSLFHLTYHSFVFKTNQGLLKQLIWLAILSGGALVFCLQRFGMQAAATHTQGSKPWSSLSCSNCFLCCTVVQPCPHVIERAMLLNSGESHSLTLSVPIV